jgi:hypothetical protein
MMKSCNLTKAEEAAMIARHKAGCELARAGKELPPDAPLETRAGYYGELRRMNEGKRVAVKPYMWRGTLNGV